MPNATHDDLLDGMPPETALCLDLCDAVGGETLVGCPRGPGRGFKPDGRMFATCIVGAVPNRLSPDDLSLVKLMERARRHLDDLGYPTADGENVRALLGRRPARRLPDCGTSNRREPRMGDKSNIEWTDATWNPITGCTKVGPGCDNCYAEHIADRRLKGTKAFPNGFDLTWRPHLLDQPLRWKRPRKIFVNSMSDLFHKNVVNPPKGGPIPECALYYIFNRMVRGGPPHLSGADQAVVSDAGLDQRRVRRTRTGKTWKGPPPAPLPPHIWLGVSVEDRAHIGRIDHLRNTGWHPEAVRFVSFEPLLGPIGPVDLSGIHWAIVGGESGPRARPMEADWVRQLRRTCRDQGVAFFFKQWGGRAKAKGDCVLDGRTHLDFPIQEM